MLRFACPYYFVLLIPAAVAVWLVYRRRPGKGLLFAAAFRIPNIVPTWRIRAGILLPILFFAGLFMLLVAAARPQLTSIHRVRRTMDAIAIMMVVDVSGSMQALDLSIQTPLGLKYQTRLDVVKQTFADFVSQRPDDLIGLITFGGYATTRVPLTADHEALLAVLQAVEIPKQVFDDKGQILNQEELLTAIGDAIATGCARLRNAETKTKIMVLLSDGESNTGIIEPETAIKMATELGIKVYTIGVGTTGRAPFKARDAFGRETIRYANVILDEASLKRIAKETGGQYFNVRDPQGLKKALEDINSLERTRIERHEYGQYHELFPRFLFSGLALVIFGLGLNMALLQRIL